MTDKEIIKALECCGKNRIAGSTDACEHCFLQNSAMCVTELIYKTLDLINRQQAEVENYSHNIKLLTESVMRLQKEVEYWQAEAKEARADIDQAVAEAIKEFAERFKAKAWVDKTLLGFSYYQITFRAFDNLVKEMAGDAE